MRVMCGLIGKYDGTVTQADGSVGYLPDAPFLYSFLTIEQYIKTAKALFNDFDETAARTTLDELGLALSTRIRETSRGLSEQVHLSIILARRCPLYAFDEPLAAVDSFTRDKLIALIGKYRSEGSTAIISTHLIHGLEELFQEAVVIHDGQLVLHEDMNGIEDLEQQVKEVIGSCVVAG